MFNRKNFPLALNCAAVAVGMLLLAYASAPLYRLFCEATGYGGTPRQGGAPAAHPVDRWLMVEFNADTDPALPWEFKPAQKSIKVRVGEQSLAFFTARNTAEHSVTGRAAYNILPNKAAAYFVKVECFCFKEQTLKSGESVHMPVSFYIDPAMAGDPNMDGVKTITLSYTFFGVKE